MSFGSFLKDTAISAGKAVIEEAKKMKELRDEYENLSDDELSNILASSGWSSKSTLEKNTAQIILKNRGYDEVFLRSLKKS